ncbi:SLOG family protein [Roseiarcaceae bacterium H3SJ34-1]|uniref:hypothetical protein n=1 Tax=Terripilifer ovatus TaxID=3032367 RepID=UPI003AB9618C|nr:SLOG family protein [Roseiarcaceae bacterium H3SJ34-1]
MFAVLVCGGRYYGRVPSTCPPGQINARIVRASEEQQQLQAGLREIHSKSKIDLLLHFNRRGAERLAAHWAKISGIAAKDLTSGRRNAPAVEGLDACRALLGAEQVNLVLQYPNDEEEEFAAAAESLGIEVRYIDPAVSTSAVR